MSLLEQLKDSYATDKEAEQNGTWVLLSKKPMEVLVARAGNPKNAQAMKDALRPFIGANGKAKAGVDEKDFEKAVCSVMAKTILLGWRTPGDSEVTYDEKEAYETLLAYPDVREEISEISNTMEVYRKSRLEEEAKNSVKPSSGK